MSNKAITERTIVTGQTINKKVKAVLMDQFPLSSVMVKRHVPGVGYTFYVKDTAGNTLGYVTKEYNAKTGTHMVITKKIA